MGARLHAVEPDAAELIHRAEVQQHAAAEEILRQREVADVPEPVARADAPLHAGQLRLRAVGHDDRAVCLRRALGVLRHGILPRAVEIIIAVAHQLRAGILRQRRVRIELFAPGGEHVGASLREFGEWRVESGDKERFAQLEHGRFVNRPYERRIMRFSLVGVIHE